MDNYQLLQLNELSLEYTKFGTGPQSLICFHGFGRSAEDFKVFKNSLGEQYTIYSFNLFYHGNASFPNRRLSNQPFLKKELAQMFTLFFKEKRIEQFSLCGYSLGGKIALALTELFPEKTQNLFLLAPDGIKANPWYYFASQTLLGQRLNKTSIKNPWIFRSFLNMSRRLGLADKKQAQFASTQMGNKEQRMMVYRIWMAHRRIKPDLTLLAELVHKFNIQTVLYIGKYERVIPLAPAKKFISTLGKNGSYIELEKGHQLNLEEIASQIKSSLS